MFMKYPLITLIFICSFYKSFSQLKRHGISNEKIDLESGKVLGSEYKLLTNNQFDSSGNRIIIFKSTQNSLIQQKFYFRLENGLCFKSEEVLPLEMLPSKISLLNKKHKPIEAGKRDDQENSLIIITLNYIIGQNFFIISYTNTLDDL